MSIVYVNYTSVANNSARCIDLFNILPFIAMKICPNSILFTKVGSKFCQILKNPQKWPNTFNFFQGAKFYKIWSHCLQAWTKSCTNLVNYTDIKHTRTHKVTILKDSNLTFYCGSIYAEKKTDRWVRPDIDILNDKMFRQIPSKLAKLPFWPFFDATTPKP